MNDLDQRTHQFHNALRAAIVVAVVLVFTYLADEDPNPEGWVFVVGVAVVGLAAAFLLVRRLR